MRIADTSPKVGDRIELIHTDDQYTSLRPGSQGTVTLIGSWLDTVHIKWDDGSTLSLIEDAGDRWKVLA